MTAGTVLALPGLGWRNILELRPSGPSRSTWPRCFVRRHRGARMAVDMQDDPLTDFERRPICVNSEPKNVLVGGVGPAVIVMAEMPGISPQVARFARWVRGAGFTVYMPSLFGRDGTVPDASALGDRFVPRVLPDSAANDEVPAFFSAHVPTPHSVVTVHLIDEAGQPTIAARDEILAFFRHRLAG